MTKVDFKNLELLKSSWLRSSNLNWEIVEYNKVRLHKVSEINETEEGKDRMRRISIMRVTRLIAKGKDW